MKKRMLLGTGQNGFTLVETMISTAITALLLGALVVMLYQFNNLTRLQQDSLTLSQQLQTAGVLLNRDVVGASEGTFDGTTLTLNIPSYPFGQTGSAQVTTVTYSLVGGNLVRTTSGAGGSSSVTVARHISSWQIEPLQGTLISTTVRITLTSALARRGSRSMTLTITRRLSQ
jgi:prepilin-type N-terminal cleavage/methylation domain-containing protein